MLTHKLVIIALTLIAGGASAKEGPDSPGVTIKGSLKKELIRDVIQNHIGEVKSCYERELDKDQNLAGRLLVTFTISPEGKVTESKLDHTTLRNPVVEKCIVEAVRGWVFPKPQGGNVVVTYPFLLAGSGEEADKTKAAAKK